MSDKSCPGCGGVMSILRRCVGCSKTLPLPTDQRIFDPSTDVLAALDGFERAARNVLIPGSPALLHWDRLRKRVTTALADTTTDTPVAIVPGYEHHHWPVPAAPVDATLTAAERQELGCACVRLDGVWHHVWSCPVPVMERMLGRRVSIDRAKVEVAATLAAPAPLCDGCNVREPWEHRCHGDPCPCSECREAAAAVKWCGWCDLPGHTTDECTNTEAQMREWLLTHPGATLLPPELRPNLDVIVWSRDGRKAWRVKTDGTFRDAGLADPVDDDSDPAAEYRINGEFIEHLVDGEWKVEAKVAGAIRLVRAAVETVLDDALRARTERS